MILFLDYDGVLHPVDAYLEKGRPVLRAEGELFMWAPLLIGTLTEHPHVRIVLSTSWVRELRFNLLRHGYPSLCVPASLVQPGTPPWRYVGRAALAD